MPLLSTFANGSARGFGFAGVGLANAPIIGTATATSTTSATVRWTIPESDGGSPIISYTIVPNDASPTTIPSTGASSYAQSVTNLSQSTNYQFRVYATNALGDGPYSNYSNLISTFGVPGAPGVGLAALAGNTSATVDYYAAFDGGSPITSYTAVSTPGGLTGTVYQAGGGTITVSGLSQGTTYQFRVYATNAYGSGSFSGYTNQITTPQKLMLYVTPTEGAATIPYQYDPVTSQGSFTCVQTAGTGEVTIQEIARPTGGSTSISPTSFFLGNGGSRGVTVYCTSPPGYFSNTFYGYNFAILYDYNPYPTYFFRQNRV
jgi:hypothetical protein